MRLGYGKGGVAAIDSRSARRWLLILLAFALVAMSVFLAAQQANAEYENGGDFFCENEMEEYEGEYESEDCTNFPFSDDDWDAVFDCPGCDSAEITIHDPMGNNIADIEINQSPSNAAFTLIVTFDKGEGPPPGKARVSKDGTDMDRCRGNHDTDCVKAKRVSGARTQYTVKVDDDPRFRFR
jgi:hypothetical protein